MAFALKQSSRVAASRNVACNAASRQLWLPGAKVPAHLKGELAGDFGFDPLNLGADPNALRWYQQAELHCPGDAVVQGVQHHAGWLAAKGQGIRFPRYPHAGALASATLLQPAC
eukprot:gene8725-8906_t